jgi:LPXTG-motif cell wall-anchored protein
MKRRYALFAVVFAVSLLIGIQVVEVADANPFPQFLKGAMEINIQFPSNAINYSYSSNHVVFNANASNIFYLSNANQNGNQNYSGDFFYILDGGDRTFSGTKIENVQMNTTSSRHIFTGQFYLTNLAEGYHTLTVYWGVRVDNGRILNTQELSGISHFYYSPQFPTQDFFLLVVGVSFIVLAVGFIFFKKKRKLNK